jgi:hypothetical protein
VPAVWPHIAKRNGIASKNHNTGFVFCARSSDWKENSSDMTRLEINVATIIAFMDINTPYRACLLTFDFKI